MLPFPNLYIINHKLDGLAIPYVYYQFWKLLEIDNGTTDCKNYNVPAKNV